MWRAWWRTIWCTGNPQPMEWAVCSSLSSTPIQRTRMQSSPTDGTVMLKCTSSLWRYQWLHTSLSSDSVWQTLWFNDCFIAWWLRIYSTLSNIPICIYHWFTAYQFYQLLSFSTTLSDKCRFPLSEKNGYLCSNVDCCEGAVTLFETNEVPELNKAELEYRIPVSLSDHTGTLEHCYLYGSVAENLIGLKVTNSISCTVPQSANVVMYSCGLAQTPLIFRMTSRYLE